MLEEGDIMFTWNNKELIITIRDEDSGIEMDHLIDEESAYDLLKFLFKKFKTRLKQELLSKIKVN